VLLVAEQLRLAVPGGIGTYVEGLVKGLRAMGADAPDVTLYASRAPSAGPDPLAGLHRLQCSPLPHRLLVWAWDRGLAAPPPRSDVVHATSLATPPARGRAMSVMVHDLAWRHHPEAFPPRGRRWHEAALSRALARARVLVVPSAPVAADVEAVGAPAGRVEVIEEGCDHLAPPDDAAAGALLERLGVEDGFLLTVSTLEPRKNLRRLVSAYGAARPRLPDRWPLVVVGPSGWGADAGAAREAGIVTAGKVTPGVVSALYRRARALVYVPLHEGFGLPPVEAMSVGTPVVASPVPSTGGAALEVDPYDVAAIADAIVEVATDDGCRAQLVAAGRRRATGLTWESAARRHVELWRSL
jgi:glycosyltransferase involved in cell wall biosynthesis